MSNELLKAVCCFLLCGSLSANGQQTKTSTKLENAERYAGYWQSWSSRPCTPIEDATSTKLSTSLSQRPFIEYFRLPGDDLTILRTRTGIFEYTGFNCIGRRQVTWLSSSHQSELMNDEVTDGQVFNRFRINDQLLGRQHGVIFLKDANTICSSHYWIESPSKVLPNTTVLMRLAEKRVKEFLSGEMSIGLSCHQKVKY
jgi:hypothetical protein